MPGRARAVQNKLIANVATIALPPPPPGPLPPLPSTTAFDVNPHEFSSSSSTMMNDTSHTDDEEKGDKEGDLALVRLLRSQLMEMQQEMKAMKQRRAVQGDVYMSGDGVGGGGGGGGGGFIMETGEEGSSALVRADGPTRSPVMASRSHTLAYTPSHTHPLITPPLIHTLSYTLSYTPSHTHPLIHTLSYTLSYTPSYTPSHTHLLSCHLFVYNLSYTLSHTHHLISYE